MADPKLLNSDYWDNFIVSQEDIEFLYSKLLELEIPQTPNALLNLIIDNRVNVIQDAKEKEKERTGNVTYLPKDHYEIGQTLIFPAMDWKNGQIDNIRKGFNPEFETFNVIDITFENGEKTSFACDLANHPLNNLLNTFKTDPLLDIDNVIRLYGDHLVHILENNLETQS